MNISLSFQDFVDLQRAKRQLHACRVCLFLLINNECQDCKRENSIMTDFIQTQMH